MTRTRLDSLRDAAHGLRRAARTERNMQLHLLLAGAAIAVALALRVPAAHLALIVFAIGLVLVAELLNTAVEALVDLVTEHEHPLARAAKDIAAGAVLVAAVVALACAGLILLPRLALAIFPGAR